MTTLLIATGDLRIHQQFSQSPTLAAEGYHIAPEAVVNIHFHLVQ